MTHTAPLRHLIVNADDFGLTSGVNQGVIEAHELGIVTSASLMVRWPAASEAATYARSCNALSVGLHFDLGEWRFVRGTWEAAYEVVPAGSAADVEAELARQMEAFRRLMGRDPSHLDSHQHVHRSDPVRSILLRAASEMGIVLRSFDSNVRYCGAFYGQSDKGDSYPEGIAVEGLLKILHELAPGFTEMGCHPGRGAMESIYREERATECKTLCDPRIRTAILDEGIRLCSFSNRNYGAAIR